MGDCLESYPIVTKLLTFTSGEVQAFLGDIAPSTCGGSAYLCGNVNSLTVGLIDAWKAIREARCANPTGACASLMPLDFVLLQKVASLLLNSTFITNIGSIEGGNNGRNALISAMKQHSTAKCYTCDNDPAPHIDYMSDYLENLSYFAVNFSNTTGAGGTGGVWNQGITGSATQVVGGAYMLKLLKEENYTAQDVQQFELDLSDSPNPAKPQKADIVEIDGTTTILVECKSWELGDANFSGLKNGTSASYTQFITYLKNIGSMTELKYFFDARRKNMSEIYVKGVFQTMLYQNNDLTNQGAQVFETIWSNTTLKGNLFPNISDPVAGKDKFEELIESASSIFYNFIKVK
ncbi:hypothetical protein [Cellulophaga sp. BC115SP]|uniref:hypothetical protein n=1 Tax=Cellulophaga sp. BC115SP TaxID=2683263 RepID=UPI0014134E5D|nr:hypothetical protein [Cellulophaga sp. BC115SP]NBB31835.1 hypothetical protein [Cellulophaga sp. BC115SP]